VTVLLNLLGDTVRAARAAGASDVEVSAQTRTLGTTRFAGSALTQAGVIVEQQTRVRVAIGTRLGAASTSGLSREDLAQAATRAVENARHGPEQASFTGFALPAPGRTPLGRRAHAEATLAFGPGERAATLAPIFARADRDGLRCAGGFVTGPRRRAVATAGGVALEHEVTEAALSLIALDDDASGYAVWAGSDVRDLDGAALADEACRKAVAARRPVEVDPGRHDVVLAPSAVA
jgi:predicted Zn-dependent protease